MPPLGIQDWVFPGAIIRHRGQGTAYIITNVGLNNNRTNYLVTLWEYPSPLRGEPLADLLLLTQIVSEWQHTGEYVLPSYQPDQAPPAQGTELRGLLHQIASEAPTGGTPYLDPQPGTYYLWSWPGDPLRNLIRIVEPTQDLMDVHVMFIPSVPGGQGLVISNTNFHISIRDGLALELPHQRSFLEPDERPDWLWPGAHLYDPDGEEFFVVGGGALGWVCVAAHSMSHYPADVLTWASPNPQNNLDETETPGAYRSPEADWSPEDAAYLEMHPEPSPTPLVRRTSFEQLLDDNLVEKV